MKRPVMGSGSENKTWVRMLGLLRIRQRPGGSLSLQCSRQEQTILTRFRSGHLRTLTLKDGNKVFPTCAQRRLKAWANWARASSRSRLSLNKSII
ncbi:hypothetical protein TNCV_946991 [Trichonephila clavipes]|nr:hypothetical protein TNCV_946991 [Trichonephila clavipes]